MAACSFCLCPLQSGSHVPRGRRPSFRRAREDDTLLGGFEICQGHYVRNRHNECYSVYQRSSFIITHTVTETRNRSPSNGHAHTPFLESTIRYLSASAGGGITAHTRPGAVDHELVHSSRFLCALSVVLYNSARDALGRSRTWRHTRVSTTAAAISTPGTHPSSRCSCHSR